MLEYDVTLTGTLIMKELYYALYNNLTMKEKKSGRLSG